MAAEVLLEVLAMDGIKVRNSDKYRPEERLLRINCERFKVIELNDAARQRAAIKRIMRYRALFATNDLTVA